MALAVMGCGPGVDVVRQGPRLKATPAKRVQVLMYEPAGLSDSMVTIGTLTTQFNPNDTSDERVKRALRNAGAEVGATLVTVWLANDANYGYSTTGAVVGGVLLANTTPRDSRMLKATAWAPKPKPKVE